MKQLPIVSILFVIGLALINTDTYGLPTLSASLYYAIATCVFCLAFVGTSWRSHFPSTFPPHVLVFNVLCAYIAGHGLITGTFGMSHFYWLANGLFFNTIHLFWCSKKTIEGKTISLLGNGLLLIAFMESMVVIAQFLRVIPSRNTLFSATGTWVNPNVTAIFLALSLHFILKSKFLSDKRVISLLLLAPVLLSIGLLQSRTAYLVGLLALGWYFRGQITAFLKSRIPFSSKIPASVIIAVIILPIAVLLFQAKKDSTAGRLLVLKNSTLVIRERPLTGTGFGLFEKTYNQFVAQHELPSNGQVNMAYNDLIELSIEGGIIALL